MAEEFLFLRAQMYKSFELNNVLDDDDDDDDIIPIYMAINSRRSRVPKVTGFVEDVIPQYTDGDFRADFRINRNVFNTLLERLQLEPEEANPEGGRAVITAEKQLLMLLWYLSNKDSYRVVSRLFNVTKSTAHKYIHKVATAICDLSPNIIVWPTNGEQETIAEDIERASHIPNCVGFIDGTHIPLQSAPGGDKDYTNRKGFFSIQAQAVVDNKMIITDLYCGWPGSTHDARVFRNSPIEEALRTGLAPGKFLIGDNAYPLSNYMVVPFRDNGRLNGQQRKFNKVISSQRQVVERTFGLLKGRFRQLRNIESRNVRHICELITTACVLHNLCVMEDDDGAEYLDLDADYNQRPNNYPAVFIDANAGIHQRDNLVQLLDQFP